MSLNRERLQQLRDIIASRPEQFNYTLYYSQRTDGEIHEYERLREDPNPDHDCGTCCCVGGWAAFLWGDTEYAESSAAEALGLSTVHVWFLFYAGGGYGIKAVNLDEATVEDAVVRLDKLISLAS